MEIEKYIILSDAQLVVFALDGDSAAFGTLSERYHDGIYKYFLKLTQGDEDDASDMLQDTFVKVFVHLDKYDARFTFGQWIYTIAHNTFIDYVRRRRREDVSIDSLPNSNSPLAPEESPEERIISEQHQAQVERFMASLPEKYRTLAELRFVREYSYEEIAAHLGVPMGTVKTQIHRLRERLSKQMKENE